jgi:hypothetical protein
MVKRHDGVSEEHHIAIARVVLNVAQLEWLLQRTTHAIVTITGKGDRTKLAKHQNQQIVDDAKMYLIGVFPERTEDLEALFKAIDEVRGGRHDFVHSIWNVDDTADVLFNTRGNPFADQPDVRLTSVADVEAIGDRAEDLCLAVIDWSDAAHAKLKG